MLIPVTLRYLGKFSLVQKSFHCCAVSVFNVPLERLELSENWLAHLNQVKLAPVGILLQIQNSDYDFLRFRKLRADLNRVLMHETASLFKILVFCRNQSNLYRCWRHSTFRFSSWLSVSDPSLVFPGLNTRPGRSCLQLFLELKFVLSFLLFTEKMWCILHMWTCAKIRWKAAPWSSNEPSICFFRTALITLLFWDNWRVPLTAAQVTYSLFLAPQLM